AHGRAARLSRRPTGSGAGLFPPPAPNQSLHLAVQRRPGAGSGAHHRARLPPAPLEPGRNDLLGRLGFEREGAGGIRGAAARVDLGSTPTSIQKLHVTLTWHVTSRSPATS